MVFGTSSISLACSWIEWQVRSFYIGNIITLLQMIRIIPQYNRFIGSADYLIHVFTFTIFGRWEVYWKKKKRHETFTSLRRELCWLESYGQGLRRGRNTCSSHISRPDQVHDDQGIFLRERLLCLLGLSLPGTNSPIEETLTIFTYWRPSKKYMLIRCWRDITRQHIGGGLDRLIDWLIDFPVMSSEVSSGPSADRTDRIDTDWKLLRVALFSVLSAQYYQLIITEDTPRDK